MCILQDLDMSIKDKERNVDYDGDTNIFYSQFLSAINRINHKNFILADAKKIIGELKIKLGNDDLGKSFFQILQSGIDGIKLILMMLVEQIMTIRL